MKILKINEEGIDLITQSEGCVLTPYLCQANVPTIGIGTTRYPNGDKVSMLDKAITKEQAIIYFKNDISFFEKAVDAMTTDLVNQNQFNALVSFAYNLGATALKGSTLLKKVNANPNDLLIKNEFKKWTYANGKVSKGLVKRRENEANLYFK